MEDMLSRNNIIWYHSILYLGKKNQEGLAMIDLEIVIKAFWLNDELD